MADNASAQESMRASQAQRKLFGAICAFMAAAIGPITRLSRASPESPRLFGGDRRVAADILLHGVGERDCFRRLETAGTHAVAFGIHPRQRLARGMVLEHLQEEPPDFDDRRIASEQMFGAAVGDR